MWWDWTGNKTSLLASAEDISAWLELIPSQVNHKRGSFPTAAGLRIIRLRLAESWLDHAYLGTEADE